MRDLWDAEYKDVDRVRGIGIAAAFVLSALASWAGWGWWSAAVFVAVMLLMVGAIKLAERKYDRIRIDQGFRDDEENLGVGWDTKKDALADLASSPRYWRETHCIMRYFNKHGNERWGVCNKPKYWRDREAQAKVWKQFPPTPEEEARMSRKSLGQE